MLRQLSRIPRNLKAGLRPDVSRLEVLPKSYACGSRLSSSLSAELGVRRNHPPDSTGLNSRPTPEPRRKKEVEEISDREWEVRTGRAIDILQTTLPHFFETGLITSVDKATGEPRVTSNSPLPSIPLPHIPIVPGLPGRDHSAGKKADESQLESIYSPKVRLSYTPPVQLPTPFPKTLSVEGIPLYLASSVFIKHTLNALYSDLHVTLHKVAVNTPKSKTGVPLPPSETSTPGTAEEAERDRLGLNRKMNREKSVFIGLMVIGISRVSGAEGQWEVNSTYAFSPTSGLIYRHTINSIEPAPHLTVYDALRMGLGNVFGYDSAPRVEGGSRTGGTAPAACTGKVDVYDEDRTRGNK